MLLVYGSSVMDSYVPWQFPPILVHCYDIVRWIGMCLVTLPHNHNLYISETIIHLYKHIKVIEKNEYEVSSF